MKISNYVQRLLPKFGRDTIEGSIRDIRKELTEHTLPPYESALPLLKDWTFKDKQFIEMERLFKREVQSKFHGNFIEVTFEILKRTNDNLNVLEKLVEKEFARDVVRSSMTYSKAQILRLVEAVDFVITYSRKNLIFVLGRETNLYRQNGMVGKEMRPSEIEWLQANRTTFIALLKTLDRPTRELEKIIDGIPDIEVDPSNEDMVAATSGRKSIDPMSLGFYSNFKNPIFYIGMRYAEWQVSRYDRAREERTMLEYQILELENSMDGKEDPKIQRAMEYTQDRLDKLNRKISKFEEVGD